MADQLDKQIHPDQDAEWRQERSVTVESDGAPVVSMTRTMTVFP